MRGHTTLEGLGQLRRWWMLGLAGLAGVVAREVAQPPKSHLWLVHAAALAAPEAPARLHRLLPQHAEPRCEQLRCQARRAGRVLLWTGELEQAEWPAEYLRFAGFQVQITASLSRGEEEGTMGSKTASRSRGRPNARPEAQQVSSPVAAQIAAPDTEHAKLLNPYDWTMLTARWGENQWWLTKQDRQAMTIPLQPVLNTLREQGWQGTLEWQDACRRLLLLKRAATLNTQEEIP